QQFQKLSAAAGRVGSACASRQEFTSCLKETLSGLARNADGMQSSGVSEEELSRTMEGLGLEDGDGGEGSLWPIMHSIMQNLLSKDVLYPSLKEITEKVRAGSAGLSASQQPQEAHPKSPSLRLPSQLLQKGRKGAAWGSTSFHPQKAGGPAGGSSVTSRWTPPPPPQYPEWLQRHRDSLPREQFEKYQEQHRVMGRICEQFEAEQPTDGDPQHRARFEMILDLMQQVRGRPGLAEGDEWSWGLTVPFAFQLQDLGHPPKELAGESPPGLNFDLEGLNLPDAGGAGGEQCQIM
ncbi:Peroxisomal biogenesis factor 19, partial [Ophiophagus hannah]